MLGRPATAALRLIDRSVPRPQHYVRTRDYCSTTQNIADMCLNVISTSIMLEKWDLVLSYATKALATPEITKFPFILARLHAAEGLGHLMSEKVPAGSGCAAWRALVEHCRAALTPSASAVRLQYRTAARAMIDAVADLSVGTIATASDAADGAQATMDFGRGGRAAQSLLEGRASASTDRLQRQVNRSESHASVDMSDFCVVPQDIAVYGGLCALATLTRAELRTKVVENPAFKQILDLSPSIRDIILDFFASRYARYVGTCRAEPASGQSTERFVLGRFMRCVRAVCYRGCARSSRS